MKETLVVSKDKISQAIEASSEEAKLYLAKIEKRGMDNIAQLRKVTSAYSGTNSESTLAALKGNGDADALNSLMESVTKVTMDHSRFREEHQKEEDKIRNKYKSKRKNITVTLLSSAASLPVVGDLAETAKTNYLEKVAEKEKFELVASNENFEKGIVRFRENMTVKEVAENVKKLVSEKVENCTKAYENLSNQRQQIARSQSELEQINRSIKGALDYYLNENGTRYKILLDAKNASEADPDQRLSSEDKLELSQIEDNITNLQTQLAMTQEALSISDNQYHIIEGLEKSASTMKKAAGVALIQAEAIPSLISSAMDAAALTDAKNSFVDIGKAISTITDYSAGMAIELNESLKHMNPEIKKLSEAMCKLIEYNKQNNSTLETINNHIKLLEDTSKDVDNIVFEEDENTVLGL